MITKPIYRAILAHAEEEYPNECCGILVSGTYIECLNTHPDPKNHFRIDPVEIKPYQGKIDAIVHSHPDATARLSPADKVFMEFFELPYVIIALPSKEIGVYAPCGYKAPLVGRSFIHGVLDCYGLVCDFYSRELGIDLIPFQREDNWWADPNSESLYEKHAEEAGFVKVEGDLQYGDMIVCKVEPSFFPNHALIFLGEKGSLESEEAVPCIGANLVLHHLYGRKSVREIYGDYWKTKTMFVLRHRSMIK